VFLTWWKSKADAAATVGRHDSMMNWDELGETGRTWRVRVRLVDHPGELAMVTARLSERGCNLLGVTVLPIAEMRAGAEGSVIDELVLRAPATLGAADLSALVEVPGARCVGVVPASVADLIDVPTGVLRAASAAVSRATNIEEALRNVLGADSVRPANDASPTDADSDVRLTSNGHQATITLATGRRLVAGRDWAPFTEVELARVPALLELVGLAERGAEPSAPTPRAAVGTPTRRQLSSLDVQFLNAETATTFTHVGGVTILDPAGLPGDRVTVDSLRTLIGSRLHLIAPLRWRLHEVPLGLDLPYWIDVGTVDLNHHIREVSLPEPGTDDQLGELIARLAETPLDRAHPLWECYLVDGLSGGRQALYTKVHHAVIDGVSCAEVLAMVLDLDPQQRELPPPDAAPRPEPPPSTLEMLNRGLRRGAAAPVRLVRSAPDTLPHLLDLPGAATLPGARLLGAVAGRMERLAVRRSQPALPERPPTPPATPFNGAITAQRAFAFTSLPLHEVKAVKNALGLTVNDVVMAMCTSALRRWLVEHDALPDGPLVASIPVSVRTTERIGAAGNEISFMLAAMPTDVADPLERIAALQSSLGRAKRRFNGTPSRLLHEWSALLPQVLHGVVSRTVLRAATMGAPPFNLFVSNVAGPQVQLYAAGARVTANHPVSVVSDLGGGINITVMSYNGHLDFGIITCRDQVPDVWDIAAHLADALTELVEVTASEAEQPTEPAARALAG
jgi:diacylglycerol O-acyltransferase